MMSIHRAMRPKRSLVWKYIKKRPRLGVVAGSVRRFSPSGYLLGCLMRRAANQQCLLSESGGGQHVTRPLTLPCPLIPSSPLLLGQVELPPADLGPTASLTQTLSLLREVLASHDSSVVPLDARQADFAQVGLHLFKEYQLVSLLHDVCYYIVLIP